MNLTDSSLSGTTDVCESIVSERNEIEKAFNQQFLALLLHDLETPLAVAKQFIDRVDRGRHDPSNPKHREVLASTQVAMNRAERILQDILDLARASSPNGISIQRKPTDIRQLVQNCFIVVQLLSLDKNIRLECRVDGNFPKIVSCDARLIERIIDNLLVNAIRHTPTGGTITSHLKMHQGAARIEIINPNETKEILDLSGIFDSHRQVELRQKKQWRSAGLGLTFSRFVAESHGGRIGAHCDAQSYVTFWFELPIV